MAKILIGTQFACADGERIIGKWGKPGGAIADCRAPAPARDEKRWPPFGIAKSAENKDMVAWCDPALALHVPSLRSALSFRAVNLPAAPGYDPGQQRHHLLPRQLLSKRCFGPLFERIGRQRLGFDDFRSNGMLLPASDAAALRIGLPLHRGPHREYNAMVIERVGQLEAHWSSDRRHSPQAALGDAVAGLQSLQRALRTRLLDAGRKRLALNRFDPLGRGTDFTQIDAMVDVLWPASDPWAEEARIVGDHVPAFLTAMSASGFGLAATMPSKLAWACA